MTDDERNELTSSYLEDIRNGIIINDRALKMLRLFSKTFAEPPLG